MYRERLKHKEGLFLALGGGAARGLAHLGILKALEENDIPIAGICGTSMGALVGACYALAPDASQVSQDIRDYVMSTHFEKTRFSFMKKVNSQKAEGKKLNWRRRFHDSMMFGRSMATGAIISFDDFRAEITGLVPERSFTQTVLPFFAVAVDLTNYREVVFDQGLLRSAVMASAAIPGVFPAVRSGSVIYVDGGWMNKIPVLPLLAQGATHVLAIDVSDNLSIDINPKRGLSMINNANTAAQLRLQELQTEAADLIWRPPVQGIHWAEFVAVDKAVEIGYQYAMSHMDEIRQMLEIPTHNPWWLRMLKKVCRLEEDPFVPHSFEMRGIWEVSSADSST